MEIGRWESLKVKQCEKICIILRHADFLECLFLQIVFILFQRQLMETLFFNHDLLKAINFISHVSHNHKN